MTQDEIDELTQSRCPKCKRWQPDLDGFGVLKCEACDYCSHASAFLDDANRLTCDLCHKVLP